MELKLEVVVVPVTDVDRAKEFYGVGLGCREDIDVSADGGYRAVQMTPPGSPCSIIFGNGVTTSPPGSLDKVVLVVENIEKARLELVGRGVDVSEIFHNAGGSLGAGFVAGSAGHAPGPDPEGRSYGSYASFSDPDGNGWLLQQVTERLPGRI